MGQIKNIKLHIVTDIESCIGRLNNKTTKDGKKNKEGWNRWQVRNQIWCLPQKDGQKNRSQSTCQIHLQILWQRFHEAFCCWYLEMQVVQEDRCWWRLGTKYFSCCHCSQCYSTSERDARNMIYFCKISFLKMENIE